jgi:hypothetical protein
VVVKKRKNFDIPKQSWNFFWVHPGHSNCIVKFVGEGIDHNTFAVCSSLEGKIETTICGMFGIRVDWR